MKKQRHTCDQDLEQDLMKMMEVLREMIKQCHTSDQVLEQDLLKMM